MSDNNLKPMTELMKEFRDKGYVYDFIMKNKKFLNSSTKKEYRPEDISIEEEYRFEGDSNPDDMAILYVIQTTQGEKGLAVNGYGVSADSDMDDFLMRAEDMKRGGRRESL